jgi:glycosyltransferase involved in cell wall biosynthesis
MMTSPGIPLFSLITPTYKRPALLRRAIRSVLCQTFRDFELIIVDDADDPETTALVNQFHDRRITLLRHGRNRGAAVAYNTGIKASRGSLISILDDDDEYYPTFLERTHIYFQSAPLNIGFVWTGVRRVIDTPEGEVLWYERIWPARIQPEEEAFIAATTIGNGFGLTMRKECIDNVGLYNEGFPVCEDTEYLFRLARRHDFATIPEVLVKIHRHNDVQLTHRDRDELRLELHQRILNENADFVGLYQRLFCVHSQRLAQLSYSLGMKQRGRRLLMSMWTRTPRRVSLLMDAASYELFGVDFATYLSHNRMWMALKAVR